MSLVGLPANGVPGSTCAQGAKGCALHALPAKAPGKLLTVTIDIPKDGDRVISGHAAGVDHVRVRVFDADGHLVQENEGFVNSAKEFFTGLRQPMISGQIIEATLLQQEKAVLSSSPMLVRGSSAKRADPVSLATMSTVRDPVFEISTRMSEFPGGTRPVHSTASPMLGPKLMNALSLHATTPVDKTAEDTTTGGDDEKKSAPDPLKTEDPSLTTSTTARDFVLGGVRYYFTFGAVLSKQGNDFSQVSPFLDFQLDKSWWMGSEPPTPTEGKAPNRRFHLADHLGFNTFFDTKLTAVGSSEKQANTKVVSQAGASIAAPITPVSYDSFLTTRKAGALQLGAYLPFSFTPNRRYDLYIAPIFKAGLITPTSSSDQTITTNVSTATTTTIVTPQKFFTYGSYGVRLGHREYISKDLVHKSSDGTKDIIECPPPSNGSGNLLLGVCRDRTMAPTNLSYLDITVGRFANFESFRQGQDAAGNPTYLLRQRPNRLNIEGALQIPNTFLVLGVSANVGGPGRVAAGYVPPQDDLRFLLGFKFDAKRIVTALVNAGGNAELEKKASTTPKIQPPTDVTSTKPATNPPQH